MPKGIAAAGAALAAGAGGAGTCGGLPKQQLIINKVENSSTLGISFTAITAERIPP